MSVATPLTMTRRGRPVPTGDPFRDGSRRAATTAGIDNCGALRRSAPGTANRTSAARSLAVAALIVVVPQGIGWCERAAHWSGLTCGELLGSFGPSRLARVHGGTLSETTVSPWLGGPC